MVFQTDEEVVERWADRGAEENKEPGPAVVSLPENENGNLRYRREQLLHVKDNVDHLDGLAAAAAHGGGCRPASLALRDRNVNVATLSPSSRLNIPQELRRQRTTSAK